MSLLVYLDPVSRGNTEWPVETIVDGVPDIENVTDALQNGPYGSCVYESNNDVCDHQVGAVSCMLIVTDRKIPSTGSQPGV